ncbi:hypothetical protein [Dinoroseobacter sp. S375]|uniref:hypothetical protein n=1 Tax=Dinoroseobacter sp. S375 TaxID=3415136 RepID=UPI003C7E80D3
MARSLMAVFFGMLFLFFSYFGGQIEGRLFPVIEQTVLTHVEHDAHNRSLVWGHAMRLRDCSFVRLEWRIGTPAHYAVVDVVFLDASELGEGGGYDFGPWKVHATPDQVLNRSFATVVHRCHPLWTTETIFWPMAE